MLDLSRTLTARVGGTAGEVHDPASLDELVATLDRLRARGRSPRLLGGGSNIVALEGVLAEPVVRTGALRGTTRLTDTLWQVEAGAQLGRIVHESARRGLTGLECCAGVPGTVGAAIRINAGGKWGTIGAVLREVTLLAPNGTRVTRDVSPADFVYRKSPFWDDVVLSAKVELAPAPTTATATRPLDRIAEVMRHKKTTQPLNLPSAGCIFRNPSPERPAGRLIDQAGLKGTRVGGALVSPVHANYFVNVGGATGRDFLELIGIVRDRVRDACGVELELEVEIWS
ncbi:MAG TPA: UDP-N-acetylmuramate dehydrogenase [Planctomycetota bacterium]|nr:UDP-N-acetylmuramate dehydrogenase [Planctomycetota bacterium]